MDKADRVEGGHPRFFELLKVMGKTHAEKSHDYSGTRDPFKNFKVSEDLGVEPWVGALVRLNDKVERIKNFAKNRHLLVKDEGVKDTLLDLANYALLTYILFEEQELNRKESCEKEPSEVHTILFR